jgi:hypothetical protein
MVASPPHCQIGRRWRWWVRSWGLSAAEQDEVWRRWRQGESLRLVARRLSKRGPSVRAFVFQTGGVQRHPPRRAPRYLTMGGTRRDQPRCRRRGVLPADRGPAGTGTVHDVPGVGPQRRPWPLPGPGRRRRRVPPGPAAQPAKLELETRLRAVVEAKLACGGRRSRSPGGCPWLTLRIR